MRARIYRSSQRNFDCKILETGEIVSAVALANLLKGREVVVGDYVQLTKETGEEHQHHIVEVEPRKNEIFRMIQREAKKKVMASNCDVLVIIMSASFPLYKRGLVDRYLVRSLQWGVSPILVFNKMDEFQPEKLDIPFEVERLKFLDVPTYAISALNPEKDYFDLAGIKNNFKDLKHFIEGKTAIFLGQSGIGKSKIITSLTNGKVQLLSKSLGKIQKGSHTTSWAEIIDCEDFHCIDSPGIRSFSLDDVKVEDLPLCFPDLNEMATQCQFPNCAHESGSKGCFFYSVKNVHTERDKSLIFSRLESFLQIHKEVSARPSWQK